MYIILFLLSFSLSFSQTISVDPDSIYQALFSGETSSTELTITNPSDTTLYWEIDLSDGEDSIRTNSDRFIPLVVGNQWNHYRTVDGYRTEELLDIEVYEDINHYVYNYGYYRDNDNINIFSPYNPEEQEELSLNNRNTWDLAYKETENGDAIVSANSDWWGEYMEAKFIPFDPQIGDTWDGGEWGTFTVTDHLDSFNNSYDTYEDVWVVYRDDYGWVQTWYFKRGIGYLQVDITLDDNSQYTTYLIDYNLTSDGFKLTAPVSVSQETGYLGPNESTNIDVVFDATNLWAGEYNNDIMIYSTYTDSLDNSDCEELIGEWQLIDIEWVFADGDCDSCDADCQDEWDEEHAEAIEAGSCADFPDYIDEYCDAENSSVIICDDDDDDDENCVELNFSIENDELTLSLFQNLLENAPEDGTCFVTMTHTYVWAEDGCVYYDDDDLDWDECLLDCAEDEPEDFTEFCEILTELDDACTSDCDEETMLGLDFFKAICEECLSDDSCDEFDGDDDWGDDYDDCIEYSEEECAYCTHCEWIDDLCVHNEYDCSQYTTTGEDTCVSYQECSWNAYDSECVHDHSCGDLDEYDDDDYWYDYYGYDYGYDDYYDNYCCQGGDNDWCQTLAGENECTNYEECYWDCNRDIDDSYVLTIVPTTLIVTGTPILSLDKDYIDFGGVFIGNTKTDSITVTNSGTDELSILSVDLGNSSEFSISEFSSVLAVGESTSIIVAFTPETTDEHSTTLVINSNDLNTPDTVGIDGYGLEPADLTVNLESIEQSASVGDTLSHEFTVCNQGEVDLDWYVSGYGDNALGELDPYWVDVLTLGPGMVWHTSNYIWNYGMGYWDHFVFLEDGTFYEESNGMSYYGYNYNYVSGTYSVDQNGYLIFQSDDGCVSYEGQIDGNPYYYNNFWIFGTFSDCRFGDGEFEAYPEYWNTYSNNGDNSEQTHQAEQYLSENQEDSKLKFNNSSNTRKSGVPTKNNHDNRDSGGPDNYGYTWIDSDEIGGPEFEWMDISDYGNYIASGYDYYNDFALPFSFNFYGNTYSYAYASTNGLLGFNSDGMSYPYAEHIPSSYEPNNFITALWADFYEYNGTVYGYYDQFNNRYIVQWDNFYFDYEAYDYINMQVHLHENGDIYFYYKDIDQDAAYYHHTTSGIENEYGYDGLAVENKYSYDWTDLHDNMAIRISTNQSQGGSAITNWLSVDKTSGVLEPGECEDVNAFFDARGIYGGDYTATISLFNADVPSDSADVNILFDVTGIPELVLEENAYLSFGELYIANSDTLSIEYTNVGTDSLMLDSFNFTVSEFTLSETTDIICGVSQLCNIDVIFTPSEIANYSESMTFATNETGQEVLTYSIDLTGFGNSPADITIDPSTILGDTLTFDLIIGDIDSTTSFTILNEGVDTLEYQIVTSNPNQRTNSQRFMPLVLGNYWEYWEYNNNELSTIVDIYINEFSEPEYNRIEILGIETYNDVNYHILDYDYYNNRFSSYILDKQQESSRREEGLDFDGWVGLKETTNGDMVVGLYHQDYFTDEDVYDEVLWMPFEPSIGETWSHELWGTFTIIDYLDNFDNSYTTYEDVWVLEVIEAEDDYEDEWGEVETTLYYFKRGIGFIYTLDYDSYYGVAQEIEGVEILFNYNLTSDNFALTPWIESNLDNGEILSGDSNDITMTLNPSDLIGGEHLAEVSIVSNDPDENPVSFFIQLDYTAPEHKPQILDIVDVPDDQGDWVRLNIMSTIYDEESDAQYTVWREFDDTRAWEILGSFDGIGDTTYYYLAPTLGNATPSDTTFTNYKVTLSMGEEDYTSDAMAGYSIDNIDPVAPTSLTANFNGNSVILDWDSSTDNDFSSFQVYSGEELLVEQLTDSYYEYYVYNSGEIAHTIYAVDNNGNQSDGSIVTLSIANNLVMQQTIEVEQYKVNYISFNLNSLFSLEDITAQNDQFIYINNDQDEFFVSGENVNSNLSTMQIFDNLKGYRLLTSNNSYNIELDGFLTDIDQPITLEPNKINLLPYLLQDCISSETIFSEHIDDILIIQDDNTGSYIPSMDINTLGDLCPGNSYSIMLSSNEPVEFIFNENSSFVRANEEEYMNIVQSSTGDEFNEYINTGQFYPIIINELKGNYDIGDEIVAYAHNNIIGATRILAPNQPIVINAYKQIDIFDIHLDGYRNNEPINLYLWKRSDNSKLKLDLLLSENDYGDNQFAVGIASQGYLPTTTSLKYAYPNPFNPITNIKFDISETDIISIDIYDITGRKVKELISHVNFRAGQYEVRWDASQYSSGIYFIKLTTSHLVDSQKIILMK